MDIFNDIRIIKTGWPLCRKWRDFQKVALKSTDCKDLLFVCIEMYRYHVKIYGYVWISCIKSKDQE